MLILCIFAFLFEMMFLRKFYLCDVMIVTNSNDTQWGIDNWEEKTQNICHSLIVLMNKPNLKTNYLAGSCGVDYIYNNFQIHLYYIHSPVHSSYTGSDAYQDFWSPSSLKYIPHVLSPFHGGEGGLFTSVTHMAMLAGVFVLLLGPPKSDRLKGRGQTK